MIWPAPVTLAGQYVTLAPTTQDHAADLAHAANELGQLWYTSIPTPNDVPVEIDRRLSTAHMRPFTLLNPTGRALGMTTYMNIDAHNRRLEIGSTWLSPSAQRSPINTEAKLLLLTHAFDVLDCIAVEFRTHRLNGQSRRAIERLGAQLDGVLRAHMVMPNGTLRDTAVYSITAADWPTIKAHLTHQVSQ